MILIATATALAQEFQLWNASEGRLAGSIRDGMPEIRGGFAICRLQYNSVRFERDGLGWSTDYPRGDQNLLVRLSQLTTTRISQWVDWTPGHAVVQATDANLFQCPFLVTSDVGTAAFSDEEIAGLRDFFLKGGLLWVDDFWGDSAWIQWSQQIGRVLPEYDIVDLTPEHPLFSTAYQVNRVPQIANIGHGREPAKPRSVGQNRSTRTSGPSSTIEPGSWC